MIPLGVAGEDFTVSADRDGHVALACNHCGDDIEHDDASLTLAQLNAAAAAHDCPRRR